MDSRCTRRLIGRPSRSTRSFSGMRRKKNLALLAFFVSASLVLARGDEPLPHLPGYEAVPLHYGPYNEMVVTVMVNGHKADFLLDTGSPFSLLGAGPAKAFGVQPVGADSKFGETTDVNGKSYKVGYVNSLTAGTMNFGGGPMALFGAYGVDSVSGRYHRDQFVGIVGADILTRYKAVINCRTRTIFFRTGAQHLQLAKFAGAQHFARVPLREETSRSFTVPATLGSRPIRLLVDTGAPLTLLDQGLVQSSGMKLKATRAEQRFINGAYHPVMLGEIAGLKIGNFELPKQSLAVSQIPELLEANIHVAGLLGIDSLAFNRAIIDFDSMSLFLK